jgi:tetratricopeptide (TPR) repeat protein
MQSAVCRLSVALLIVVSVQLPVSSRPSDEITDILARAQALYYEADFGKSIEALTQADDLLRNQTGHTQEKAAVKLQMALAFIGLNDKAQAKHNFSEMYALEPDHQMDPQVFAPKVIQLAEEAKAEQSESLCRSILNQANETMVKGDTNGLLRLIDSNQSKCPALSGLQTKIADLFFKDGLDAYKKSQLQEALQKFQAALRADSKHELAAQYLDLTKSKLEVAADRALIAWRKDFGAGEFVAAAKDYRDLVSQSTPERIQEARSEYRRALSAIVDSWNAACAKSDTASMESLRVRATALLPETSFVDDILSKMKMCTPTGCLQMTAPVALVRLRNRVDPEFSPIIISQLRGTPVTVRVKTRISETGVVVSADPQAGNPILYPAVRAAVDQWKFSPAVVEGQARCVDTEIPLVINFKN